MMLFKDIYSTEVVFRTMTNLFLSDLPYLGILNEDNLSGDTINIRFDIFAFAKIVETSKLKI